MLSKLQEEFAQWLSLPDARRGVWDTEESWAAAHNVTTRSCRRWKTLEPFKARMAELAGEAPVKVDASRDETDYHTVKATLIEGAKTGNAKALELYFRTYGKPFVEEEVASRSASFDSMDLDDLIAQALAAVDVDAMADHLRSLGWSVEAP